MWLKGQIIHRFTCKLSWIILMYRYEHIEEHLATWQSIGPVVIGCRSPMIPHWFGSTRGAALRKASRKDSACPVAFKACPSGPRERSFVKDPFAGHQSHICSQVIQRWVKSSKGVDFGRLLVPRKGLTMHQEHKEFGDPRPSFCNWIQSKA